MKFAENQYLFSHPFATLTSANWRKYPNEYSHHVLSVDTISRDIDPKTGVLRSERLVSVKQSAPALLRRLCPIIPEVTYFREVSFLDVRRERYTAISNNLTARSIVDVEETCEFTATDHPDSPEGGTVFRQRAAVSAMGALSYVAKLVEEAAVSSFKANAWKGRLGLETVVDMVVEEAKEIEAGLKEGIEASIEGLRKGSVGL
ncbi:PRELI-like family-domain-containing protein [Fimicolochytrium jonesii]|uniref:PRELI-like family-domain-containing protein n=1 Tax=Fimicolochytrium jonesii TaxID=1396493 RepID=UPI0022FE3303|nr:PRELI-like family-domain-containing protein [Fimicolochytrium jonesii]KAI8818037.1 PRELI-like family-domain-containing protein [Fimicolochytrium jonesii]